MEHLKGIVELISAMLDEGRRYGDRVAVLRRAIEDGYASLGGTSAWEILADLAYDLEFYEPSRRKRREAGALYGDEDLEVLLRSTLAKLTAIDGPLIGPP